MNKDIPTTGLNDYETPPDIFAHWHSLFSFELDACASHYNAKLPEYYSEEVSCFTNPWKSRNWMNPPYNKPENPCKTVGCAKKTCQERGHCIAEYRPGLGDFVRRAYEQSLGFRQLSRQRTLFRWKRPGYRRRGQERGIDAVHWVRLDSRFGAERADHSRLPPISLSRLRQTVQ
jgi:DNA N-6-adenine-methyltransferase (Dam)